MSNLFPKVAAESSNDAETQRKTLMSMVFPPGAAPDNSPLHVICCNDTCSFTWTGAEHINQDIFECRSGSVALLWTPLFHYSD